MIRIATCTVMALSLALGACGKKGDPKRPQPEGAVQPAEQPGAQPQPAKKKQTN